MLSIFRRLMKHEGGATAIEYTLIASLIAVAAIVAMRTVGTKVNGVVALRTALLAKPEMFVNAVTEKLFIYALGRGLDPRDMPQVRSIVRNASHNNYKLTDLILGVVNSTPFQMNTAAGKRN